MGIEEGELIEEGDLIDSRENGKSRSRSHREKDKEGDKRGERGKGEREKEKDKYRERDRDGERERGKERDSEREKKKDAGKGKEKDKSRQKGRDGEGGGEKDKDGDFEKDMKEKPKDKQKEKDESVGEKIRVKGKEREEKNREKERDHAKEKERVKSKREEGLEFKDKGKEREKEKEKLRVDEREKPKEKYREKEEKDKKEVKDKGREKDRNKEKEREKEREKEKEKEREKEREKEKQQPNDKEKEKDRLKERERESKKTITQVDEKEKEKEKENDNKERGRDRRGRKKDKEAPELEADKTGGKGEDNVREEEEAYDKQTEGVREREKERERKEKKVIDKEREGKEKLKEAEKVVKEEKRNEDQIEAGRHGRREQPEERSVKTESSVKAKVGEVSTKDLADRIGRMKEDRLKESKIKQAEVADEDDGDIASWVEKSRILTEKKKAEERAKAARTARMLSEMDEGAEEDEDFLSKDTGYNSKDLAGLKVRHGLDKVLEGGAVILTLKDSSILDDGDVNEAMDELENVEIAEQLARERAYKESKKTNASNEDKFQNDINQKPVSILAKYDEALPEEGITLDSTGGIDEESRKRLEDVRHRLQGLSGTKESLSMPLTTLATDYLTHDEIALLKKPKKKKKIRRKEVLDYDALEAEAKASGLEGAENFGGRDRAARRTAKEEEEKERVASVLKSNYQNAYNKAADNSKTLREPVTMDIDEEGTGERGKIKEEEMTDTREVKVEVKAEGKTEEDQDDLMTGDEDMELERSLEIARQRALKKRAETAAAVGPQALVSKLALMKEVKKEKEQGGEDKTGLVFTDTGEFCRSLQLDDAVTRRAAGKDVFAEEDEEVHGVAREEGAREASHGMEVAGGWTEVHGEGEEGEEKDKEEVEEDEGEEEDEILGEAPVGKGLGAILGLLKERGALQKEPEWGGRDMDKKKSKLVGILDSVVPAGQKEIRIDRRDEFGREMTPKEAFRVLSHKFHGKGPGKMKQEKRIKQYEEELKRKQMTAGDTPLMSMEKMREVQAHMNAPYIVISGQIKPGQTSDPRSSFGVEKEHMGSLTPMLGDKKISGSLTPMLGDSKVEHFLGIKRKSDNNGMGPPPPKKTKP